MTWRGIIGQSFTPDQFQNYVADLRWQQWRPRFAVLHNTGDPTLKQWHGPTPAAQRIKNLESYYRDQQHWSAGPHLFIADDLIWVFSPLIFPGVHSPSWNSISWGIEMVGDYNVEPFDTGVRDNTAQALTILHAALGMDPATLHFHKEDPLTTHKDCPGKNVVKSDMIMRINAAMASLHFGEHKLAIGG